MDNYIPCKKCGRVVLNSSYFGDDSNSIEKSDFLCGECGHLQPKPFYDYDKWAKDEKITRKSVL